MRFRAGPVLMLLGLAASGCSEGGGGSGGRPVEAAQLSSPRLVDSAVPIEEALDRFRRDLPRPAELEGGAGSREELVRGLVQALEARDTASLRRMMLTAGEFAWLYYPSSRFSHPPYELAPDLLWFQLRGQSERGATRLLSLRAGAPLGYLGHQCDSVRTEGANRLHGPCQVRHLTAGGDTIRERLFGLVLERQGRFKYVTYANDLD